MIFLVQNLVKSTYSTGELYLACFHCTSEMFLVMDIFGLQGQSILSVNVLFFTLFALISKWSLSVRNWTAKLNSVKTSEDHMIIAAQTVRWDRVLHDVIIAYI